MTKHEPYKIKSIRNIPFYRTNERVKFLREARFNVGKIPSSKITFDMVIQGSGAMSQEQVGALFLGDEAYAGARNFYKLNDVVKSVFGFELICPVHNRHGGLKLLSSIFVSEGKTVASNSTQPLDVVEYFKGSLYSINEDSTDEYKGNMQINDLSAFVQKNKNNIPFMYIDLYSDGYKLISLQNLASIREIAESFDIKLVLDFSCITQYVYNLRKTDSSLNNKTIAELVRQIASYAHTVIFDAGQDAMSNVGGFLATNDSSAHEKYQNEVVVYEGLHTYGGMAGRTMEVVAIGLQEMTDDLFADWIDYQTETLSQILQKEGVPFERGFYGVYLRTEEFMSHIDRNQAQSLAAALYLGAGIRTYLGERYSETQLLPVLIPRRALMNTQIEQIAYAIVSVYNQRKEIQPLELVNNPIFHFEAEFRWVIPTIEEYSFHCEPYIIHSIEHVGMKSKEQRQKAIVEAGYNTFLLKSEDVTIDFLTDSGTSAMSVEQWSHYLQAQETPATSDAYEEIVKTSQEIYGYNYVILTHQGRAAEHIMSQMFIQPGDYVPGNMYFTTTKLHQEMAGGVFVDIIVDEAHKTDSTFPWKGNIDIDKLLSVYEKATKEGKKISYVSFEFNVNMAGGQPVSMQNIKEVYTFCKPRNIPVFFDATRCAENACFIQRNDPYYKNTPVRDILLEMFSYGDGATISCKKDMLSNLSGTLLFKDREEWYRKALQMLQLFEGPYSSGGTSAGDMAAHAQGLREMVDDAYINSRIEQAAYLGSLLQEAGVPIVTPAGGHAIFLDARKFLSHLDQDEYPAQMLAAQIFVETGLRAMERGNVSKGRDPKTGDNYRPALELVRLTIPRRVYTRDHLKAAAEGIIRLYKQRNAISGLCFMYEPLKLRFFQSRFKEHIKAK